jgi:predicted RNase H-like HicB family nuclease
MEMGGSQMNSIEFVYWEDDGWYIGYLQDYPDYWTQGENLDDLKDHLRDIHEDIVGGHVKLQVA